MYSREQWATDFLKSLGNHSPNKGVIAFVVGWTKKETSAGQGAKYNLLNTEEKATGSTDFNAAGVQNFVSYHSGVDTNAWLVKSATWFSALYRALLSNDENALGIHPQLDVKDMSAAVNGDLQVWVSGKRDGDPEYPKSVLSLWGQGATDQFVGDIMTREQYVEIGLSDVEQASLQLSHLTAVLNQLR